MKIKRLTLYILPLIILLTGLIYSTYIKNTSFDYIILKCSNQKNINKILIKPSDYDFKNDINSSSNLVDYDNEKVIKNKGDIDELISNISKIKLIRYYGDLSNQRKGSYYFFIYENNKISLYINISGKEYVTMTDYKTNKEYKYKIIDNSLDLDSLYNLIFK
ncbi:hypothetical protein FDA39_09675 [Clostridium botulinum]|nr:hypothetical protein [Clostridium botulinum]